MTTQLTTDWLRIGRSGATVDGRTIKPEMISDAADTYNPELYTALIWLEHMRFGGHLGKVLSLRASDNEEGGRDLYAKLSPNRSYLAENQIYNEGWFSSMELTPDFRKSGRWYLTGLGATNEPASVATTEIRFSKIAEQGGVTLSPFQATETKHFQEPVTDEKSLFSFLTKLFKQVETEDMKEIEQLKQQLTDLSTKFDSFAKQKPSEATDDQTKTDIEKLSKENAELKAQVETFKANDEKRGVEFSQLQQKLTELTATVSAALKEQPGTESHKSQGAADSDKEEDLSAYL
jgi:hypothetical protein